MAEEPCQPPNPLHSDIHNNTTSIQFKKQNDGYSIWLPCLLYSAVVFGLVSNGTEVCIDIVDSSQVCIGLLRVH